jgi:hypothetical protein
MCPGCALEGLLAVLSATSHSGPDRCWNTCRGLVRPPDSDIDSDAIIAETVLRAADNYRPGPATWDWQLNLLHYARTSWRPDEVDEFRADVEVIVRGDED